MNIAAKDHRALFETCFLDNLMHTIDRSRDLHIPCKGFFP